MVWVPPPPNDKAPNQSPYNSGVTAGQAGISTATGGPGGSGGPPTYTTNPRHTTPTGTPTRTASPPTYHYLNGNAEVRLITQVNPDFSVVTSGFQVWLTGFSTGTQTQYNNNQVHKGMIWQPIRRAEQSIVFTIDWPLQGIGLGISADPADTSTTLNGLQGGNEFYPGTNYDFAGFKSMVAFHKAIQTHQNAVGTGQSNETMNFLYYNNYAGSTTDEFGNTVTASGANNYLVDHNLSNSTLDPKTDPSTNLTLTPIFYQGWITSINPVYDRFQNVYSMQYIMNVVNPAPSGTTLLGAAVNLGINPGTGDNKNFPARLVPTAVDVATWGPAWTSIKTSMNTGIDWEGIPR